MNFSSDSVKPESKTQNEDFYLDLETPRGHFFAVIDFGSHDFANLNATLTGKVQTIVESFVSLSRFSADLFLGFLAKEINNFVYNLREHAGGPQLVGSTALCLLSGDRLTYFLSGDVGININNGARVLPLQAGELLAGKQVEKLGTVQQETPLTDAVQTFTLEDNDIVLVMTHGVESVLDSQSLGSQISGVDSSDAKAIRDELMKASVSSTEDRTLLVITGPYERYVDPLLSDLTKAVASLEGRLNALAENDRRTSVVAASVQPDEEFVHRLEDNFAARIELLKEELGGKARTIDVLELDEKVKSLSVLLASKADNTDVLSLQSDVLKLSVASEAPAEEAPRAVVAEAETPGPDVEPHDSNWQRSFLLKIAGIVLLLGFGSAFAGAWVQSRLMRRSAVAPVALPSPVPTPASQSTPSPVAQSTPVEIVVKPGDSLRKLAQQYNVPEETIMQLNPTVTRWATIQSGQKIFVPATPAAIASPSVVGTPSAAGTIEVIVGPGDSINRFAQRYQTTPERIRELNPHITNWPSIQTGQKVLVPTPPSG